MAQFARPTLNAAVDDGITLSTKLNGAFPALYTNHAGAAAPPSPEKGQMWVDTSGETANPPVLVLRQYTGTVWREVGSLNLTTGAFTTAGGLPLTGGTMNGPILFPAGTAAAPSIAFAGDTGTGIWRIGANNIGFSTNGVQRISITNTNFDTSLTTIRVQSASPTMVLDRSTGASGAGTLRFRSNNSERWAWQMIGAESTGDAGGNLFLQLFNDTGALTVNFLQFTRAARQMGVNGAAVGTAPLTVRTTAANPAEDAVELVNANTDLNGSVSVNFRTAGGALRSALRAVRPGNNNGDLQIHTATVGVLNLCATFRADGGLLVEGELNGKKGLFTDHVRAGWSAGFGMEVFGYAYTGQAFFANVMAANPNWAPITWNAVHQPGVDAWGGMDVNGVAFRFNSTGIGLAPGGWQTGSDRRVKQDIQVIDDPLVRLSRLTGYTFTRADLPNLDGSFTRRAGVMAQDAESALPESVCYTYELPEEYRRADEPDHRFKSVDSTALVGLLVEAVKSQQELIVALQNRLSALEGKS